MSVATRKIEPEDAPGLTRCIGRCYGDSYPLEHFHDPDALAQRIESGRLRSVVALSEEGEVVGHIGLTVRDRGARVAEAGNTVVDPAHRGRGVLRGLGVALVELCRELGLAGFVHYPTTAHELMQRTSVRFGGAETGVMLAHVPAETDYAELERPSGRLATTVVYQPIDDVPERAVALPERHTALLERLYSALGIPRSRLRGRAPRGRSSLDADYGAALGLLQIAVSEVGADLAAAVAAAAAHHPDAAVVQVDLPLTDRAVGAGADELAGLGFFYCGLLPEFAPGDVLRLQRLSRQPRGAYHPQLANESGRRLLAYVNEDRERHRARPPHPA